MKPRLLALLAVLLIGCAQGGTRFIEGLGVDTATTFDPVTGKPIINAGFNITFRDARDSKTIRQPSIQ